MTEMAYNLLREPLLTMDTEDGREMHTLPSIFANLARGRELEPSALQPHQFHPWYAFLVQLAALAQHRAGCGAGDDLSREEEVWRQRLLNLTEGEEAPWCLVVEDLSRPAFFQAPVPEGNLKKFKGPEASPSVLDVLVTTRNHDVKSARLAHPRAEHWIYGLTTLQTYQGFSGRDNYGIARMNGGFASRPCVTVAPELSWHRAFARDVRVWLEARPDLIVDHGYRDETGLMLLWLEPWDGKSDLGLGECDPFFIEVCRRVRLRDGGTIKALTTSTVSARLAFKDLKGATGDVWTPVRRKDSASLTVGEAGFSYRLLQDLLFESEYALGAAGEIRPEDGDSVLLVARVLVRGQGKTAGYHERIIPIPPKARVRLLRREDRARLGIIAGNRVTLAAEARRDVLRPALCALFQGGPEKPASKDERRPDPWLRRLDDRIDEIFFDELWEDLERSADEGNARWGRKLAELAEAVLQETIRSAPIPVARRFRAIARAEGLFHVLAKKHLTKGDTADDRERSDSETAA